MLGETSLRVVGLVSDLFREVSEETLYTSRSSEALGEALELGGMVVLFPPPRLKSFGGGVKNSSGFLIYKCNKYCLRNFLL